MTEVEKTRPITLSGPFVLAEAPRREDPSPKVEKTPTVTVPSAETFKGQTAREAVTRAIQPAARTLAAPAQQGVSLRTQASAPRVAVQSDAPKKPGYAPPPQEIKIEVPTNIAKNINGRVCGRSPTNYEWDFACDGVPNGALPLVGTNWEYVWDGDQDGIPGWTVP